MTMVQLTLDAVADMGRITRSNYHLTLGQLIAFLDNMKARGRGGQAVVFSDCHSLHPCTVESYRGYYSDLAFTTSRTIDKCVTVTSLLKVVKAALDQKFTGYKGGEFIMDHTTPLWRSDYGKASDNAIVGIDYEMTALGGAVVLQIKRLDDGWKRGSAPDG